MWRFLWMLPLLVGCAGDDRRSNNINDLKLLLSASVTCDPNASAFDWLVVFEAETSDRVIRVDADAVQGGYLYGPVTLDEDRPGQWYGEIWEDDLGVDCDAGVPGADFYLIADDGAEETFEL